MSIAVDGRQSGRGAAYIGAGEIHGRASAVGERAARALRASGGLTQPIEGFADAPYHWAGNEIVWIGTQPRAMHPRMVVLDRIAPAGVRIRIDVDALMPWQVPSLDVSPAAYAARITRELPAAIALLAPRGLGNLLFERELPFPLALARSRIEALADARAARDPAVLTSSSIALLGVGTGLTPSGDDFVGGMLFAMRWVDASLHAGISSAILAAASARTHVISAALLVDLAEGASYSVLHNFAAAPTEENARALTSIGHSSGWDLLAGFALGATGKLGVSGRDGRIGSV